MVQLPRWKANFAARLAGRNSMLDVETTITSISKYSAVRNITRRAMNNFPTVLHNGKANELGLGHDTFCSQSAQRNR
jgi:hypothetical protein